MNVEEIIEKAAYYLQQVEELQNEKANGPGITLDLNGDFLVVTKES